ncbi:hypothetical protein [Pseudomonas sp. BG2dil]|nr:hypothetical protein [Pseudomonas sp. M2]HDS1743714.1 hypothetical protein [Pseudomonas putida]
MTRLEPLDLPLPDYPAPGLIGEALYLRYAALMAQAANRSAPLADDAVRHEGRRLASDLLGQAITLGSSKAHEGSDEIYWLVQSAAIASLFADGAQCAEFARYRQHVAYYSEGCRTAGQVNAFDRYVAANGQPSAEDEVQSRSADDHYRVMVRPWEAGNTHWVYSPRILDTRQGTCLLSFQDACWSADASTWHSGSTVELALRKYPGHRARDGIRVVIDCTHRCALLEGGGEIELAYLEAVLQARLEAAEPGSR